MKINEIILQEDITERLKKVSKIVNNHFEDILKRSSTEFIKEMKHLEIRVLWDSPKGNLYGEYYGVPATIFAPYDNGRLPPEIIIFARPLIADYGVGRKLSHKLRKVLLHEIGHHLGLSEKELRERGIY